MTCAQKDSLDPNVGVASLHDRMSVIVKPLDYGAWLDSSSSLEGLRSVLRPYPHWQVLIEKL
jgi:putative SOS response-associated peptidase YedK